VDDISPQTSLLTTHRLSEASAGCTFRVSFSKHCHCTTGHPHISCLHPRPGAASHTNLLSLYSRRTAHRLHCMATCRLMVKRAPWPQLLGSWASTSQHSQWISNVVLRYLFMTTQLQACRVTPFLDMLVSTWCLTSPAHSASRAGTGYENTAMPELSWLF
jgi:hypothetical protein